MARLIIFGLIAFLLFGCIIEQPVQNETTPPSNVTTEPITPSCTDNDGGANILTKGKVISDTGTFVDYCTNSNSISEYSCSGAALVSEVIACPKGTACSNGACVAQVIQENTTKIDCIDSDNGLDFFVSGTVSYYNQSFSDNCVGSSSLLEYSCVNDELNQTLMNCGVGNLCQDGACVRLSRTCTDSDSSDEYDLGTTVQYGGGMVVQTKYDSCVDNQTIREFYCNSTEIGTKTLSCSSHSVCSGGLCVPLCEDGDGGIQTHVSSYVRDQSGTYNDYCLDDFILNEYICESDRVVSTEKTCSGLCRNGKCYELNEIDCAETNSGRTITLKVDSLVVDSAVDSCIDYRTKNDYRCFGGTIDSVSVECESTQFCYAGKCQDISTAACYDLDAYVTNHGKGTPSQVIVTDSSSVTQVKSDFCLSSALLSEFSCDGTNYKVEYIDCGIDEACIDGACIYPYVCIDNHRGSATGSVSLVEDGVTIRTEKDACTSDTVQRKVSCDINDKVVYTIVPCPAGTTCDSVDGSCK
ncbi:Uncharacterised protein [Candidatus Bilamarchaeum dharawalense]|uniref:Uncharacterized protein n=1 Tax=Candidatus Bilamarchaeum dharawalense TaxID=2885759 RepID=A0A5E4LN49_9ARCH|nr:Uncharacterised protein [Candidatus Bilamarchaeum dharawalense]